MGKRARRRLWMQDGRLLKDERDAGH
jgi:hypothetical protein